MILKIGDLNLVLQDLINLQTCKMFVLNIEVNAIGILALHLKCLLII